MLLAWDVCLFGKTKKKSVISAAHRISISRAWCVLLPLLCIGSYFRHNENWQSWICMCVCAVFAFSRLYGGKIHGESIVSVVSAFPFRSAELLAEIFIYKVYVILNICIYGKKSKTEINKYVLYARKDFGLLHMIAFICECAIYPKGYL